MKTAAAIASIPNAATAASLQPVRWNPGTRLAFRFIFCYFLQYALFSDHKTVLERAPVIGRRLQDILFAPYRDASLWLGAHVFHLTGASIVAHGSGFGDRAVDWISAGLMLAIAALAALVWTMVDEARGRRAPYRTLFAWLRFLLRLTLGLSILWYASIKLFPVQIEPASLAVLNEPVGQLSPMTLLWSMLGFSHTYERICGVAELCGGVLILYRRTALLGALLTAFILTNIFLFDFFFDVAVKLYSFDLLLMCLVVLAPDVPQLFRLFWSHRPAAAVTPWGPPIGRRGLQRATVIFEIVFFLSCLHPFLSSYRQYAKESAGERHPSPLAGQWHLDSSTLNGQPHPLLTGDGQPIADLFLEPSGRTTVRAADGTLWGGGRYDNQPNLLSIASRTGGGIDYAIAEPDATHLVLTPVTSDAASSPVLKLSRVPISLHYRIYDRGFHWVNEWGFEQ